MKTISLIICLCIAFLNFAGAPGVEARVFRQALPGYQYQFPHDHVSHEEFRTEWWYYTGHLKSEDNQEFGYELTFFRTGIADAKEGDKHPWKMDNVYLAHFALSDVGKKQFVYFEKLNRGGLGPASAAVDKYRVVNENWYVEQKGGQTILHADNAGQYVLDLQLQSLKPEVIHGKDGVSQKASCKGCASHYYSQTRLASDGNIVVGGKKLKVSGVSWMDHEFGSNQLTESQVGWDWYSIQLDNNTELMLYVMRNTNGGNDPNSSGTFVLADGKSKHLQLSDFSIKSNGQWKSTKSTGTYPMGWQVEIPSLQCKLTIKPAFENQELATAKSTGVTYWEGASSVEGIMNGGKVKGQAYVEMTGYAEKFHKNI